MKEALVADLTLENRLLKKSMIADGGDERMRYPASEKLEIIRLVERSHTSQSGGRWRSSAFHRPTFLPLVRPVSQPAGLRPGSRTAVHSRPGRVWNRIPDEVRRTRS